MLQLRSWRSSSTCSALLCVEDSKSSIRRYSSHETLRRKTRLWNPEWVDESFVGTSQILLQSLLFYLMCFLIWCWFTTKYHLGTSSISDEEEGFVDICKRWEEADELLAVFAASRKQKGQDVRIVVCHTYIITVTKHISSRPDGELDDTRIKMGSERSSGVSIFVLASFHVNTWNKNMRLQPFANRMAVAADFYWIRKWTKSDQICGLAAVADT